MKRKIEYHSQKVMRLVRLNILVQHYLNQYQLIQIIIFNK
jgi:hypothetical protein